MSICDPFSIGIDFCANYGGDSGNHIDCATGWSDTAGFGQDQADAGGCDVGGAPCLDFPSEIQQHTVWYDGNRWLRPSNGTRDAMGREHDLVTDEPWPVPPGGSYEYAPCYENVSGEQCFRRHVCTRNAQVECWPGGFRRVASDPDDPLYDRGCGDAAVGEGISEWFPDVFTFSGTDEPSGATRFQCRMFNDPMTKSISLGHRRSHRVLTPAFPRFSAWPHAWSMPSACTPNMLVPCSGKIKRPGLFIESAFLNSVGIEPDREHWMDDPACRNMFQEIHLIPSADIHIAGGNTPAIREENRFRSAILNWVLTNQIATDGRSMNFARLDQQFNTDVSHYNRHYNPARGCQQVIGGLNTIDVIEGVKRSTGERVRFACELLEVYAEAYIVLHKVSRYSSTGPSRVYIEPHARIGIFAEVAYRSLDEDIIPNDPDCTRTPIPAGVKFSRNGVPIDPPRVVEWLGFHGRLGVGWGGQRIIARQVGTLSSWCQDSAEAMGTLQVFGFPNVASMTRGEPYEAKAWPYMGSIGIRYLTRQNGAPRC